MTRSRSTTFLAGLTVVLLTAVLAGCGGGDDPPAPPKTANGQAATLGVGTTDLGKILVDSKARTLYLFKRDSDGRSTCAGACASEWPPLRASGTPTVGSGANGDLLAITKRTDGAPQLSYRGTRCTSISATRRPATPTARA